jgi:hypothetical protein
MPGESQGATLPAPTVAPCSTTATNPTGSATGC